MGKNFVSEMLCSVRNNKTIHEVQKFTSTKCPNMQNYVNVT